MYPNRMLILKNNFRSAINFVHVSIRGPITNGFNVNRRVPRILQCLIISVENIGSDGNYYAVIINNYLSLFNVN